MTLHFKFHTPLPPLLRGIQTYLRPRICYTFIFLLRLVGRIVLFPLNEMDMNTLSKLLYPFIMFLGSCLFP